MIARNWDGVTVVIVVEVAVDTIACLEDEETIIMGGGVVNPKTVSDGSNDSKKRRIAFEDEDVDMFKREVIFGFLETSWEEF